MRTTRFSCHLGGISARGVSTQGVSTRGRLCLGKVLGGRHPLPWTDDRQTGVKILPCPKHHLWAVNISLSLSLCVNCLQSAILLVQGNVFTPFCSQKGRADSPHPEGQTPFLRADPPFSVQNPLVLTSSGCHCSGRYAFRAFVNTHLLVHKHVKISVDEWILETTCPQKHVKFLEQYIP